MIRLKILATADSHFGFLYGRTAESRKVYSKRMFKAFDTTVDFAVRNEVDLFLHGGDMFNRSKPDKRIISKAYELINKLTSQGIPFVGIPVNHDKSILPETLLSHFNSNLHLQNKFSEVRIGSITILSFPFNARNPNNTFRKVAREALRKPEDQIIVLCHQLFDGAVFGPHQHKFTNRPDTLDTSILPENIRIVISGHIHRAQRLQEGRIFYTGSLERTSFMEIIEPKGFLIFDLDKDAIDIQFVENKTFPMDVLEIEIGESDPLSAHLNSIEVETDIRTLIRIVGRTLSLDEIRYLWSRFPAKEYPYLSLSPKRPNVKLKSLYNDIDIPFMVA